MVEKFSVPPELLHLIEKRAEEERAASSNGVSNQLGPPSYRLPLKKMSPLKIQLIGENWPIVDRNNAVKSHLSNDCRSADHVLRHARRGRRQQRLCH